MPRAVPTAHIMLGFPLPIVLHLQEIGEAMAQRPHDAQLRARFKQEIADALMHLQSARFNVIPVEPGRLAQ